MGQRHGSMDRLPKPNRRRHTGSLDNLRPGIQLTPSYTHASESYTLNGHESALFHILHVPPRFFFDISFPFFLPRG
jgi:hypothetical protein